jgi:hypothetical protein
MRSWWVLTMVATMACSSAPPSREGNAQPGARSADRRVPSDEENDATENGNAREGEGDRQGDAVDASASAQDGGADASSTPSSDASAPAAACEAGATVFAFSNGDRWQYSTVDELPSGWTRRGAVFKLAKPGTTRKTHDLYLLYSAQADDFLVTTTKTEGSALGYTLKTTLGRAYEDDDAGATKLFRFVKPTPNLRHYVTTNVSTAPSGFTTEGPISFVCPK